MRLMVVLVACVVVNGCSGKTTEDLAKTFAKLEPKIGQINALGKQFDTVAADIAKWPTTELKGLDLSDEKNNAVVVLRRDLAGYEPPTGSTVDEIMTAGSAAEAAKKLRPISEDLDPFLVASRILGKLKPNVENPDSPNRWKKVLERLDRAKYVVIVDAVSYLPSKNLGSTFSPGSVRGKAIVFDIEKGQPLGGVVFEATNSEKISSYKGEEDRKIRDNLAYQWGEALDAALEKRFPGHVKLGYTGFTSW
jgi:hypothetical protein